MQQQKDEDYYYKAYHQLRFRKYDQCIDLCTEYLSQKPLDQIMWTIKTKALALQAYLPDSDFDQETLADQLIDEDSVMRPQTSVVRGQTAVPMTGAGRRGTALPTIGIATASSRAGIGSRQQYNNNLQRPGSSAMNQSLRPMTQSGRPITGFLRPGTMAANAANRLNTSRGFTAAKRLATGAMTARGVTGAVRRLNTASLVSEPGGPFINVDRLDLKKYANHPVLSRTLFEYILYQLNNPKKALELASLAILAQKCDDWWWKAQSGRCFRRLNLLRDAEKQLKSSLKDAEMLSTIEELGAVYLKLNQPQSAMELYQKYLQSWPNSQTLLACMARVHESRFEYEQAVDYYRKALYFDMTNVEAISSLASDCFYTGQPEVSLVLYQRLLQMGVDNAEIWANVGLCCIYAQQWDIALKCFDRALVMAGDDVAADIWYNIGHVAVNVGDLQLAKRCWHLALATDNHHAESYNNLGVLEQISGGQGTVIAAKSNFASSIQHGPHLFEPAFNTALLSMIDGDFQAARQWIDKELQLYPAHQDGQQLAGELDDYFG